MSLSGVKIVELERKMELVLRGLNLLLFEESEEWPMEEVEELRARLQGYVKGRSSEFVGLRDSVERLQADNPQEGS